MDISGGYLLKRLKKKNNIPDFTMAEKRYPSMHYHNDENKNRGQLRLILTHFLPLEL